MDNRLYLKIPDKTVSWTTFSDVYDYKFWIVLLITLIVLVFAFYTGSRLANEMDTVGLGASVATVYLSLLGLALPSQNGAIMDSFFI